jgi:hypothetical protein
MDNFNGDPGVEIKRDKRKICYGKKRVHHRFAQMNTD